MSEPRFCPRCTAAGRTSQTVPHHGSSNNKLCEFYKPRKKRKRSPSPNRTTSGTPLTSSSERKPWWDDNLREEYERWWRPREPSVGMTYPTTTTLHRMPRRRLGLIPDIFHKSSMIRGSSIVVIFIHPKARRERFVAQLHCQK